MIELAKVRSNFDRRARHFRYAIASTGCGLGRRELDRLVAHTVIELETAIAYAVRTAYLAGSIGGRSASGVRYSGKSSSAVEALWEAAIVVRKKKPTQIPGRDEPSWSSANHVSQVASDLVPANQADIIAAMGVFPEARRCVKAFRNFYAHRSQDTLREAREMLSREYGLTWSGHPTVALLAGSIGDGSPVLETWIWNYVDVVHTLCG